MQDRSAVLGTKHLEFGWLVPITGLRSLKAQNLTSGRNEMQKTRGIDVSGDQVNRTYGTHKNIPVYIFLFLPTIFGPIYYGTP